MLTIRHKISGVAPAVNDFKGKAVVLLADLVLAPGEEVDVTIPQIDTTATPRLLVAMQGAADNVESGAGPDLFSLLALPEELDLQAWLVPHRGSLVLPIESSVTAFDVTTVFEGLRVGNPSTVEGRVRLLVTT